MKLLLNAATVLDRLNGTIEVKGNSEVVVNSETGVGVGEGEGDGEEEEAWDDLEDKEERDPVEAREEVLEVGDIANFSRTELREARTRRCRCSDACFWQWLQISCGFFQPGIDCLKEHPSHITSPHNRQWCRR